MSTPIHPAAWDEAELLKQCEERRGRASGPGGQHRNKVETAATITHQPTGVEGWASERRHLQDNRRVALFRLRVNLALEVRCDPSIEPSELWQSRCRGGAIACNPEHTDFPAMLAEALDRLASVKDDPAKAASALGCTTSQLIKLLKAEPRALVMLNQWRQARGLHALR
jgi:hypothetical protein